MIRKIRKGGYEIEIVIPDGGKSGKAGSRGEKKKDININISIDDDDDMDLAEMDWLMDD